MNCLGVVICATGITSREEKSIKLYATELGAKYSANFTKHITHLIVKKVGSEKHALAQRQNIFCVEMKWLMDSKTSMSRMNEESYQVLPFTGLNISVSQLEPDERHRITRIVESNGGKFGRNIEKDVTTHLICLRPEGDKYQAARSWKSVKIVTAQWIDDCVKKQMWIDERDYPVFPSTSSISSTQTTIPSSARSLPPPPSLQPTLSSTASSASVVTKKAPSKLAPILKRALSKIRRNLKEHTQGDDLNASAGSTSEGEKGDQDQAGAGQGVARRKEQEIAESWDEELGQLSLLIPSAIPLSELERRLSPHVAPLSLRNEVIFVSGFDDQTTLRIVKLIVLGSGFRSAILSEKISKCLLGPKISDRLLHSVVTHPLNPEAVTLQWLLDTVLPYWRSLCVPTLPPHSPSPPPLPLPSPSVLPLPLQSLGSGSGSGKDSTSLEQESEEIQLRERLYNTELWSSKATTVPISSETEQRKDEDRDEAMDGGEMEERPGEEEGQSQGEEEGESNCGAEYEVKDDSEEEEQEEVGEGDWWLTGRGRGREDQQEEEEQKPSRKRTRWEGGGRRKKLLASSSQSSSSVLTQDLALHAMAMGPPSRSRAAALTPPRPSGSHRRTGGGSGSSSSPHSGGAMESQLVVYEADTQPLFDPDWL